MTGHLTQLEVDVVVSEARLRAEELASALRLTRSQIEVLINETRAWRNAELVETLRLTRCEIEVLFSEARAWRNAELAEVLREVSKALTRLATKFRRIAKPGVAAWH